MKIFFRSVKEMGAVVRLSEELLNRCEDDIRNYYNENIRVNLDQCVQIALQASQGGDQWHQERKKRITGSKAFPLSTYWRNSNPNWEQKYNQIYHSTFRGNEDTIHGLMCEDLGREKYQEKENVKLMQTGLLIRPEIPWLGFSPDGLVLKNGVVTVVYEQKSPKEGKKLTAEELHPMGALKKYLDESGKMRKKNDHYGQVQIAMFLLGVEEAHYVNYSLKDDNNFKVPVKYDPDFVSTLTTAVCNVYFREILPRIVGEALA